MLIAVLLYILAVAVVFVICFALWSFSWNAILRAEIERYEPSRKIQYLG